jgi:methyl-accepting chemotaxis protein
LLGSFGLMAALLITVSASASWWLQETHGEFSAYTDHTARRIGLVNEVIGQANTRAIAARNLVLSDDEASAQQHLKAVQAAHEAVKVGMRALSDQLEHDQAVVSPHEKQLFHALREVDARYSVVAEAGTTMADIVDQVQRVADLIGEISSASHEQTAGIGQVNDAVTQLDQVTQQNAALVEESAAAAESLKLQAHQLTGLVARFSLAGA